MALAATLLAAAAAAASVPAANQGSAKPHDDPSMVALSIVMSGAGNNIVTDGATKCSNSCTIEEPVNSTVTLTAYPGTQSTFYGFEAPPCEGTYDTNVGDSCTVYMSVAKSIDATFAAPGPETVDLSIEEAGDGSGVVSDGASVNCGLGESPCYHAYVNGEYVPYTATPNAGSSFAGWGPAGACAVAQAICNVAIVQDSAGTEQIVANFTKNPVSPTLEPLTVTETGTGSGTVTDGASFSCSAPSCTTDYDLESTVTFTATPAAGSTFVGWTDHCNGTGTCLVTMYGSESVSAVFDSTGTTTTTTTTATPTTTTTSTTTPGKTPPVATVLPHAVIDSLKITNTTTATIAFNAKGGTATAFECSLVAIPKPKKHHKATVPAPQYAKCTSPAAHKHLKAASYEFSVRAKGVTGGYTDAATKPFKIS